MNEAADLKRVLLAEREALLHGRVSDIAPLTQQKLALLRLLETRAKTAGLPDEIRTLAAQNATLLEAVARGIKSALGRVEELKSALAPITYDANGARHVLTAPIAKREERA